MKEEANYATSGIKRTSGETLTIYRSWTGKYYICPCTLKLNSSDTVDIVNSTKFDVEISEFKRKNKHIRLLENPANPSEYPLIIESRNTKSYVVVAGSSGGIYKYKIKLKKGPSIKECEEELNPCGSRLLRRRKKKKRATVDPEMIVE